jgi:hypothetical protein
MTGLNFENLKVQLSEHWEETDRDIWFVHNFSDVRAAIDVKVDDSALVANNTLHTANSWLTGHNVVYNDTEYPLPLLLEFIVNGKGRV